MSGFTWDIDGVLTNIIFSLIRNAEWVDEETRTAVIFEYLDNPFVCVSSFDLDIEESEYGREVWNMLLQVTNLEAT